MQTLSDFGVPNSLLPRMRTHPSEPMQEQTKATIPFGTRSRLALLAVADIRLQRSDPRQV
jgi:hypothetical protein